MNEERKLLTDAANLFDDLEPVLRKGIDSLQHDLDPQSGMLKQLIQDEVENYEVLLTKIQETNGQIDEFLNPNPDFTRPAGPLCVTMADGQQIHLRYGSDTFANVIEKLGIEEVRRLGLKYGKYLLVDTNDNPIYNTKKSGITI